MILLMAAIGVGSLIYGASLIHPALAWIVVGVLVLAEAIDLARKI